MDNCDSWTVIKFNRKKWIVILGGLGWGAEQVSCRLHADVMRMRKGGAAAWGVVRTQKLIGLCWCVGCWSGISPFSRGSRWGVVGSLAGCVKMGTSSLLSLILFGLWQIGKQKSELLTIGLARVNIGFPNRVKAAMRKDAPGLSQKLLGRLTPMASCSFADSPLGRLEMNPARATHRLLWVSYL